MANNNSYSSYNMRPPNGYNYSYYTFSNNILFVPNCIETSWNILKSFFVDLLNSDKNNGILRPIHSCKYIYQPLNNWMGKIPIWASKTRLHNRIPKHILVGC